MNARSTSIHIRRNTVVTEDDGEEEAPAKIKNVLCIQFTLSHHYYSFKVIVIMANTFIVYEYFQSHMVS